MLVGTLTGRKVDLNMNLRIRLVMLALVLSLAAMPASGQAFADLKSSLVDYSKATATPRKTCEAMGQYKAKEISQISAAMIPVSAGVPAHCRITGLLSPEIAFEVSLPSAWNGRFYMIGNGGHAGEALDDAGRVAQRNAALQQGFAFAQTNTGHDSRKEPGATFVLSNPQKAIDYAYRAVHLTATTSKEITKDYYGKSVSHSYWNSCSNGGRQGLIEAQRFPDDFDGIVANAPWVDQTGFTIGAMWNQKALRETPVSAAKLAFMADKVMEKCDAIDGLKDGLIDDPRKCNFDPARDVPACPAGDGWRELPYERAGRNHFQGLWRACQQRQAVLPRVHAGKRGRHLAVRWRYRKRLDECHRKRTTKCQTCRLQPG